MKSQKPLRPIERGVAHKIQFDLSAGFSSIIEKCRPWGESPNGIALAYDGNTRPQLYESVGLVLKILLNDPETEVEYHDDPEWEKIPQLHSSLREITDEEISMELAICQYHGAWGVGLGWEWDERHVAAKVALASVLYCQARDLGASPEMPGLSAFKHFVHDLVSPAQT